MPSLADVLIPMIEQLRQRMDRSSGSFEVATTTPDFTVYLNGSATAVPARPVQGSTFTVGDRGDFIHRQGQTPLCFFND